MKRFNLTELSIIACALIDYRNHAEGEARSAEAGGKPEYLATRHYEAARQAQKLLDIFGKQIDAITPQRNDK